MTENDHTKLLLSLLRYKSPGERYLLLTSFLIFSVCQRASGRFFLHTVRSISDFVFFCSIMGKRLCNRERCEDKKRVLWQQLEQLGCLWSCAKNPNSIEDSLSGNISKNEISKSRNNHFSSRFYQKVLFLPAETPIKTFENVHRKTYRRIAFGMALNDMKRKA